MSLTNAQYDAIQRDYDRIRLKNAALRAQRLEEVCQNLPAYQEWRAQRGREALDLVKARLLDTAAAPARRALDIDGRQILQEGGYASDYLDPIYDCPLCQDSGITPEGKCSCFLERERRLLYAQTPHYARMSPLALNEDSLDASLYQGEDALRFQKALDSARALVERASSGASGPGLLLMGKVGCGKTHLALCAGGECLRRGLSVLYFGSTSLFDAWAMYTFSGGDKDGLYNFQKEIYNVDLVILDDLGTELLNEFVATSLFSLINERLLAQKPCIITTNLSLETIQHRYSDRVISRILGHYELRRLSGADLRLTVGKRGESCPTVRKSAT